MDSQGRGTNCRGLGLGLYLEENDGLIRCYWGIGKRFFFLIFFSFFGRGGEEEKRMYILLRVPSR